MAKRGPKKGTHLKQFCKNGHDVFVCGRDTSGTCNICKKDYLERNKEKIRKQQKENRESVLASGRRYYAKHKKEILAKKRAYNKQWRLKNRERLALKKKQWQSENLESHNASTAKNRADRKQSVVSWGQEGILEFYVNTPNGMSRDHVIPLVNDNVRGLHVIWNLQYLTLLENEQKGNRIDLLWASEWYGKLLEKEGLK